MTTMKAAHWMLLVGLGAGLAGVVRAEEPKPPGAEAPPPARAIPGLNTEDRFRGGCVDCHVALPTMDVRLSTLMAQWGEQVRPALLAKAQAAAPAGLALKGKHPGAPGALKQIPGSCLPCHGKTSKTAPPFAQMIHLIHLAGEPNHFLAEFQGECTHCHKLDLASGHWSMPSGPEK